MRKWDFDDRNTVDVSNDIAARAIKILPALKNVNIVRGWEHLE